MKKYETYSVFTPSQPAQLTFVDRDAINKQLVDSIRTPGKQLVVYGFTGSGKTTLITQKINQLYSGYIPSQCTKGTTIDQLKLDAFDHLNKFYVTGSIKSTISGISASLKGLYSEIKAESKVQNDQRVERIVPMQLTDQRLAEFIGESGCCWKIEDFHKVDPQHKKRLAQIMKVFMDSSMNYPSTKIIVIGAVGTGKEVVQYDADMKNRISEISVPLMSIDELEKIIDKGEKLLNVEFPIELRNKITIYSSGLAAVCHQLCLSMCINNNIYETATQKYTFKESDLTQAIDDYLMDNSASLKSSFDKAIKSSKKSKYHIKDILKAILSLKRPEVSRIEILNKLHKTEPKYPSSTLTNYLKQLISSERDEVLRLNTDANLYYFSSPFFKAYCELSLSKETAPSSVGVPNVTPSELRAYLAARTDFEGDFEDEFGEDILF